MTRQILLVDCPDAVGLIHRITGVLQSRQLNIEANHEFVDATTRHFFFRAEVTPADGTTPDAELCGAVLAVLALIAQVALRRWRVRVNHITAWMLVVALITMELGKQLKGL